MVDKPLTKVRDLTPNSKQVNVLAKVLSVGEPKEVMGKFGDPRKVCEAVVGDDTAVITLSLWNEQIGSIAKDEVILVDNGYVSLVRGHMRLNVGPVREPLEVDRGDPRGQPDARHEPAGVRERATVVRRRRLP